MHAWGAVPQVNQRTLRPPGAPVDWGVRACVCVCLEPWLWENISGLVFAPRHKYWRATLSPLPIPRPWRTLTAEADHDRRPRSLQGWPWCRIPLYNPAVALWEHPSVGYPTQLREEGWRERVEGLHLSSGSSGVHSRRLFQLVFATVPIGI